MHIHRGIKRQLIHRQMVKFFIYGLKVIQCVLRCDAMRKEIRDEH